MRRALAIALLVTLAGCGARIDKPRVVIFYGSEVLGSLDGCGCMGNPRLGGLPYRIGYTRAFASEHTGAATLQIDAGASMKPIVNAEGRTVEDWLVENDTTLSALDAAGYDALNLTDIDAPFLARLMTRDAWDANLAARPVLGRYVSANIAPARDGLVAPAAYIVRPAGSARVAVTGVSQPNAGLEQACGYRVTDASAALDTVLPRMRAEADIVVVLAYLQPGAVEALAAKHPGMADVWIAANSIGGDVPEPRLDAPERVTSSWYKTQKLGVLTIAVDGKRVTGVTNEYVKLEDPLPRDSAMEQFAVTSRDAVRAVKERRYAESAR
jgi:2',3'-cyclic-nucleotide 2'-phosphodiesterase (5'-nucleotidase family)